MSDIQNIRTEGTQGANSSSGSSTDNLASDDTKNQNKEDFGELEAIRNRMTSQSSVASNARVEAIEYVQQAQQYNSEAKTSSSIEAVKQLIDLAKEMIIKAKEQIKIMMEAAGEVKDAKTELGQKAKIVQAPSDSPEIEAEDPNGFLFNQKKDTLNDI